jgi:hypothetical protein
VAWAGPLAVRLVAPTAGAPASSSLRRWLGDRTGRVHHLAFEIPGPLSTPGRSDQAVSDDASDEIPGVVPGTGSVTVVAAADNLGTGLVLQTSTHA